MESFHSILNIVSEEVIDMEVFVYLNSKHLPALNITQKLYKPDQTPFHEYELWTQWRSLMKELVVNTLYYESCEE